MIHHGQGRGERRSQGHHARIRRANAHTAPADLHDDASGARRERADPARRAAHRG